MVGRIYNAIPKGPQKDKFYLRLLLTKVTGYASLEEGLCFDGTRYNTYAEVCVARRLTTDYREWKTCLEEAATYAMPKQLRSLFVTILFHNAPADPLRWTAFHTHMAEHFKHQRGRRCHTAYEEVNDQDISDALHNIDEGLKSVSNGTMSRSTFNLPPLDRSEDMSAPTLLTNETNYDKAALRDQALHMFGLMNPNHKAVASVIQSAYSDQGHNHQYFIHAPGGTGKTFIFTYLLAHFRGRQGKIVLAMACIIGGGLLRFYCHQGVAQHESTLPRSTFRIPIHMRVDSMICNVSPRGSQLGEDEASPHDGDRYVFECCVERFLRLFMQDNRPFGEKLLIIGGDFRQNLPVAHS